MFQFRFGFSIEDYYGAKKYAAIYILSGIGGNLLSATENPFSLSVGASTSIYGLLAVLACYYAYNWHTLGVGRMFNLYVYLGFVGVNFIISWFEVTIDLYGHLGGFIVGGLMGLILIPREEFSRRWNYILAASTVILAGFFIMFFARLASLDMEYCEKKDACTFCNGLKPLNN